MTPEEYKKFDESFSQRMKDAMIDAGVEKDSFFAHVEPEALGVDKAWQFGFLQGWLMCLKDQVKENHKLFMKVKQHGLQKEDPGAPHGDGTVHDDNADSG